MQLGYSTGAVERLTGVVERSTGVVGMIHRFRMMFMGIDLAIAWYRLKEYDIPGKDLARCDREGTLDLELNHKPVLHRKAARYLFPLTDGSE
jgi:hypothetical protein